MFGIGKMQMSFAFVGLNHGTPMQITEKEIVFELMVAYRIAQSNIIVSAIDCDTEDVGRNMLRGMYNASFNEDLDFETFINCSKIILPEEWDDGMRFSTSLGYDTKLIAEAKIKSYLKKLYKADLPHVIDFETVPGGKLTIIRATAMVKHQKY